MSVGPGEMRGKQVSLCYANQLKHSCSKNDTGGGGGGGGGEQICIFALQ